MTSRTPVLSVVPLLVGCLGVRNVEPGWLDGGTGDGDDAADGSGGAGEIDVQEGCDEDDVNTTDGWRITGSVFDMYTREVPADPESLCAYALDPVPVLSGSEPKFLAGSQVCENGDYVIAELGVAPTIGMFVSIDDCEGNPDTVMSSATGIDYDDVKDLGDGDLFANKRAYLVSNEYGRIIGDNLDGFDGDAVEIGFMTGFVLDSSDEPVSGARLSCGGCADFYYMDTDDTDGLFASGGVLNSATDAAAEAVFVAPGAPIATYVSDDGGNHDWEDQLFGSLPGYASFLLFNAQ
jgi:hypothetical protein